MGKGRDGSPRDSHLPEPGTRAPEAENLAAAPAPVCTSAMRKPLQGSVFSLVKWEPQGCQGRKYRESAGAGTKPALTEAGSFVSVLSYAFPFLLGPSNPEEPDWAVAIFTACSSPVTIITVIVNEHLMSTTSWNVN